MNLPMPILRCLRDGYAALQSHRRSMEQLIIQITRHRLSRPSRFANVNQTLQLRE